MPSVASLGFRVASSSGLPSCPLRLDAFLTLGLSALPWLALDSLLAGRLELIATLLPVSTDVRHPSWLDLRLAIL